MDREPVDGVGQQRQRHQRIVGNVRHRTPFQARAAVVPLVLEDHGVQREQDLGLGQPGQHHDLLAAFRIALVGHGAATDLLLRPAHLQLADLPAVQGADLVGDPRQGRGDHGQGADELGNPVAGHVPTRQRHVQRQPPREAFEQEHGLVAEGGHRAHAAEQLHHQDPLARLAQAFAVTQQLVDPAGHLQPEGGRQRRDRVGPGDHQRIAGPARQHREPVQEDVQRPLRFIQHIAHFQGLRGVLDILRGRAEMHVLARAGAAVPLQRAQQGHQRVPGAGHTLGDLLQVDGRKPGGLRDLQRRLGRNDADIGLRQRQRRLHVEPALQAAVATEDPAAHRAGVAAAMGFRVNDVTVFVLAGRLGRCAAEALRMRGARGTGKHFQRFSIHHLSSITYWD